MTTPPVMSVTDELIAELDSRMNQSERGGGCSAYFSNDEVRRLLSERAELKRDAERYLAALAEAKYRIEQGRVWAGTEYKLTGLHSHGQQKALDVIDTAMEQTKC